jgi:hypothetical protein
VLVALGIQHAMRMIYFHFKHDVTAACLALLLLIRKGPTFESDQTSRFSRFSSVHLQMGLACGTYGERGGAYKVLEKTRWKETSWKTQS